MPANGAPHLRGKPVKAVPVHAGTSRAARGDPKDVRGSRSREAGGRGNGVSRGGGRGGSSWPGSRGGGSGVERGGGHVRAVNRGGRDTSVVMPTNMRITIFNELVRLLRRCPCLILARHVL